MTEEAFTDAALVAGDDDDDKNDDVCGTTAISLCVGTTTTTMIGSITDTHNDNDDDITTANAVQGESNEKNGSKRNPQDDAVTVVSVTSTTTKTPALMGSSPQRQDGVPVVAAAVAAVGNDENGFSAGGGTEQDEGGNRRIAGGGQMSGSTSIQQQQQQHQQQDEEGVQNGKKEDVVRHHHQHDDHHDDHNNSNSSALVVPFMPFFTSPKQRQRWGDAQRHPHTNWGDIFFDLFYVAAAYNLGNLLKDEPTARGLLYLAGLFLPIMGLWNYKMYYDGRFFHGDDIYHRAFEVAVLVAMGSAVLHIRTVTIMSRPSENVDMFAFCLALSVSYVILAARSVELLVCYRVFKTAGLYPEVWITALRDLWHLALSLAFYIPATVYTAMQFYNSDTNNNSSAAAESSAATYDAAPQENYTIAHDDAASASEHQQHQAAEDDHGRFLAGAVSSASDATSPSPTDDAAIWLCLAGAVAGLVYPIVMILCVYQKRGGRERWQRASVPLNIDYAIHRYGEWVMLMLGESVLSLLIVDLSTGWDYYVTFFAGIISIILLEFLHFQSQPHDPDAHALRRSKASGLFFTNTMIVYSTALIILGASYKMLLYEYVYEDEAYKDIISINLTTTDAGHGAAETEVGAESTVHRLLLRGGRFLDRILAATSSHGVSDALLGLTVTDRRQRIAHFFAGSLALVWTCMDLITIAHAGGPSANLKRCQCKETSKMNYTRVFLAVTPRVALIAWMASLSQYCYEYPNLVALLGLAGIVTQLGLRVLGAYLFIAPPTEEEKEAEYMDRAAEYSAARIQENSSSQYSSSMRQ